MSEFFYGWLAFGVLALIVEMATATFFALAFSLSAFIVAAYVAISDETSFTLIQAVIFAVTGGIFSFLFPKWFNRTGEGFKQGLDGAVGNQYPLKKTEKDWKVVIDGVEYLVSDECVTQSFAVGKRARVESHSAGTVTVSVIE